MFVVCGCSGSPPNVPKQAYGIGTYAAYVCGLWMQWIASSCTETRRSSSQVFSSRGLFDQLVYKSPKEDSQLAYRGTEALALLYF